VSRLSRIAAVVAFALAYLIQPLALDACSVSCEAARAARAPAVAAPCHHTTSCATQISQPASPGSAIVVQTQTPPVAQATFVIPIVQAAHPYYLGRAVAHPPDLSVRTTSSIPLRL
jgi:hypothetical protein